MHPPRALRLAAVSAAVAAVVIFWTKRGPLARVEAELPELARAAAAAGLPLDLLAAYRYLEFRRGRPEPLPASAARLRSAFGAAGRRPAEALRRVAADETEARMLDDLRRRNAARWRRLASGL